MTSPASSPYAKGLITIHEIAHGSGWQSRADCRDHDPEIFFPVSETQKSYLPQIVMAKQVCEGCPVREICLSATLHEQYGISGGLTSEERRALRRTLDPTGALRPTPAHTGPKRARADSRVIAAGKRQLIDGNHPSAVALSCGVSDRTAQRWLNELRIEHPRLGYHLRRRRSGSDPAVMDRGSPRRMRADRAVETAQTGN